MTRMKDAPVDHDSNEPTANARTAESIAAAPLPTRGTLRARQNLLIQSWRFVRFNLKMMRVILRGHG